MAPTGMVPTKIGRYQILGELGRGAMGQVWRAFDPNVGRNVALKTVPLDSADPELSMRFRREAQAAGILSHPNIVTIYDAGSDEGFLYIAMELVEGVTLQKMLTRGPLPMEQAIAFAEQAGAALDHAHARAIIHRDIKPGNIMVQQGVVKVTDFGVAKNGAAGMTSTGQILGTPMYLAPEVVKGGAANARSDIFSLGVVLYEMLTGIRPFSGENITTVIYQIISEQPLLPTSVVTSLPAGLNYVVLKALAKSADDRYQSCAELVADLKNHAALAEKGHARAVSASRAAARPSAAPSPAATGGDPVTLRTPTVQPIQQTAVIAKPAAGSPKTAMWMALAALAVVVAGGSLWWQSRRAGAPPFGEPVQPISQPSSQPPTAPAGSSSISAPGRMQSSTPAAAGSPQAGNASSTDASSPAPVAQSLAGEKPTAGGAAASPQGSGLPRPLAAPRGRLVVHTQPPGARILVNGTDAEYRSPVNFALPPGKYQITVERAGYQSETREVVVVEGHATDLQFDLQRSGGILRRLPFRR